MGKSDTRGARITKPDPVRSSILMSCAVLVPLAQNRVRDNRALSQLLGTTTVTSGSDTSGF